MKFGLPAKLSIRRLFSHRRKDADTTTAEAVAVHVEVVEEKPLPPLPALATSSESDVPSKEHTLRRKKGSVRRKPPPSDMAITEEPRVQCKETKSKKSLVRISSTTQPTI